jgi:hypothetical protein
MRFTVVAQSKYPGATLLCSPRTHVGAETMRQYVESHPRAWGTVQLVRLPRRFNTTIRCLGPLGVYDAIAGTESGR